MIKAVIFDLDGTIYIGNTPLPGAAEAVEKLKTAGIKTIFLTNAATGSRADVVAKLSRMNIKAERKEVYTASYLLAKYITENHKAKKVFVIGEKGIFDELNEAGAQKTEEAGEAGIVAVGLDRKLTYDKLCKAQIALSKGAAFVVSSMDHTYPTEIGEIPGSGAIVTAIAFASGKKPYIVGKPNPYVLELIGKEHDLKKNEMLMVGDRIDTDVVFAKNSGIKSALVLSGTSKKANIKEIVPDYVLESVRELPAVLLAKPQ